MTKLEPTRLTTRVEHHAKEVTRLSTAEQENCMTCANEQELSLPNKPLDLDRSNKMKRLRFVEANNQYYKSTIQQVDKDTMMNELWYTRDDFERFKNQTYDLANVSETATTGGGSSNNNNNLPPPWSRSLVCIYFAFRTASDDETMQQILDSAHVSLNEHTVGLQNYVWNCPIVADYHVRRRHLLQQIYRLQSEQKHSPSTTKACSSQHEDLMRQTSQLTSQAPRLFARVVARARHS